MIRFFSDIQDVKVTEKLVYKIIHQYGPIAKNEAFTHVGSSLATVSRIIDSLAKKGMIRVENEEIAGGRTPSTYTIDPEACYSFGAYISADVYGIGLCDMSGKILEKTAHLFSTNTRPAEVVDFFTQFITTVLSRYQIDSEKISGIGVSVEGPILREKGIIYHPYHLTEPGWEMVSLKDLLEMKTGHTVWVDCIAETALMSELVYGEHKGCAGAAYLRVDKGIGCAIYANGMFGMGSEDFSSRVGHTVIDFRGKTCVCGRRGCLETYGAMEEIAKGISARTPDLFTKNTAPMPNMENVWEKSSLLLPFESCRLSEDPAFREYFEELTDAFAVAIVNFLYLTSPKILFLAGRTIQHFPVLLDRMLEKIRQEYTPNLPQALQCVSTTLDDRRLITGSSFLVFNSFIQYFSHNVSR
ncbi:MAG: ROK family transcriptional regulator [bacterium]|nr:ROK family transcriptional regulator [bacterium]